MSIIPIVNTDFNREFDDAIKLNKIENKEKIMIGIKGFGLSGKKKEPPSSSGSKGAFNINYDSIVDSHNALMAGKVIDRLFGAINNSIEKDGNRTSRTMKDLFLTNDVKDGIKDYVMKNNDMVKELLKGIKEDLEIKE